MKTRISTQYFVVVFLLMGVSINPLFSQEPQTQGQPSYVKRGFSQMSNDEMAIIVKNTAARTTLRVPSPEEWLKDRQIRYNESVKMLLWDYYQVNSDDWYNGNLDMSGLQKLEWVVKTNKATYQQGEPVGIQVFLRNISTDDVRIWWGPFAPGYFLSSMKITKIRRDRKQEVYLTKEGFKYYDILFVLGNRPVSLGSRPTIMTKIGLLQPGDMTKIYQPFQTLNLYYELSEPGEYELTFYTRNYLEGDEKQIGEYPKPCTIRFIIEGNTNWLDSQVVWPEEDK